METIKEICDHYGLKMVDLHRQFGIPIRTIQDWYSGVRTPPKYVVEMIVELLEHREKKGNSIK